MSQSRGATIPSLDGLRAISILFVFLGHGIGGVEGHSFLFRLALLHSGLGVEVFFVISGYLITSLLLAEKAAFGSISLRLFYLRRALRILPAFLVFVGTVFVLSALGYIDVPSRLWIFILTYTVNFTVSVWNVGHLWSLSVEEHFYLLWPLVVRYARLRTCVGVAILAIFGGVLIPAASAAIGHQLLNPALRYATPLVLGPIAMGCLLAIAEPWVERSMSSGSRWLGPAALAATAAILVLDTIDAGAVYPLRSVILDALLTFVVARLVFRPVGLAANVLNSRSLVFVGKLSYSLYLWQQLFMNPFSNAPLCRFPWNVMAACATACASWFIVESRFLKLRARFRRTARGRSRDS